MTFDANGLILKPLQPMFDVSATASQSLSSGTITKITFDTENADINSDFDLGNNKFIAPVAGKYQFNVTLNLNNYQTGIGYSWMKLVTSNREHYLAIDGGSHYDAADYNNLTGSVVCDMDSGDTAKAQLQLSGGQASIILGSSSFSGNLVA